MTKKPSVFIAMPCYDSVKTNTMLSIFELVQQLTKSGIEVRIQTIKTPLVHQGRNYLASVFLTSPLTYLLFIDSDVEFEPAAVIRMIVAKKNMICTPYRIRTEDTAQHLYPVEFKDPKNVLILADALVEIESGPTGLMLIHRKVFEKIIKNNPDLKIKNKHNADAGDAHEFYYNFFHFKFKDGYTWGEDVSFCKLARENGFKIYANIESSTTHHGGFAWTGKFGDSLKPIKEDNQTGLDS